MSYSSWFPAPFFLIFCSILPGFLLPFWRFLISCSLLYFPGSLFPVTFSLFPASFSLVFLPDLHSFLVSCFLLTGFSAWFTLFPGFYPFSPLPFLHTHSYLSTPFLVLISWSDLTYSVVQSRVCQDMETGCGEGGGGYCKETLLNLSFVCNPRLSFKIRDIKT